MRRLAWVATALLVFAPLAERVHGGQPAWPAPDAARIKFVRSLDPRAVRGKPSLLSRLAKVLVGGEEPRTMAHPHGMAVGPDGRLFVVDSAASLIHVYGLVKNEYRTIEASTS